MDFRLGLRLAGVAGVGAVLGAVTLLSVPAAALQRALGIKRPPLYVPEWIALTAATMIEKTFTMLGKSPPVARKNIESTLADRVFSTRKAREELGFETDLRYYLFGPVRPWSGGNPNYDGGEQLRLAMAQNPFLHVMVQSGFYDGATDYFTGKYVMWHIDPSGRLQDRMRFEGYRSGHMMYLRAEDLESSNEHIREFIAESLTGGAAASYGRVGPPPN